MQGTITLTALLLTLFAPSAFAQTENCNAPAALPSVTLDLPMHPFGVQVSRDGCWVFVAQVAGPGQHGGIAVISRRGGKVELARVVPVQTSPTGIALTHDGKLLIAAATTAAVFLDVAKMISGHGGAVVGTIGKTAGAIQAAASPDDRLAFIAEERAAAILTIDLGQARKKGFSEKAVIGRIPTGLAPIAMVFSRDGKWMYSTAQAALPAWRWPNACKPEGVDPATASITRPEGAVVVVDVARAGTEPAASVVARVPAGCSAVRMAMSPGGDRLYVTARNSNAVIAFDATKLAADGAHAKIGMAEVGTAPAPVAVIEGGAKVVAGNSNRFAGGTTGESLTVLDAAKIGKAGAVVGQIATGAFPREMAVSADGKTLFFSNFGSNSLQMIDIGRLPVEKGTR